MTKNELNTAIAAVLSTALDTEPTPFPESYGYMALNSDINKWQIVKTILVSGELATMEGNAIKLTNKGRDIARLCNSALSHKIAV